MESKRQNPIWPYLAILAFLFVLSLTAPRAWERKSRPEARSIAARVETRETAGFGGAHSAPILDALVEPAEPELDAPREEVPAEDGASVEAAMPPAPEGESVELDEVFELPGSVPAAPAEAPEDTEPAEDEVPREPDYPPVVATSAWPLPRVLIEQLEGLAQENLAWPGQAIELIVALCRAEGAGPETREILRRLESMAAGEAAAPVEDRALTARVARARYGLARWLDIWSAAAAIGDAPLEVRTGDAAAERIRAALAELRSRARHEAKGADWCGYLKLDALEKAARAGASDEERRAAARAALDALASPRLSREQRRFADQGTLATLQDELAAWAEERVSPARLVAHIEQYEYSSLPSDGWLVANDLRGLRWSAKTDENAPSPARREGEKLTRRLDAHYRNANVRVAVAGALLDRMIPQPDRIDAPVRERVVNVPVRGRSSTFTKLSFRLIPDERRIRLGLEAHGTVASNTVASSGPATFRNRGQSSFVVRKLFVLGPQGLSVWPAMAEAENDYNYLVSLETDFDGVPLVGSLVRSIAMNQHDEARGEARLETAEKVAIRALHQLDAESQARLVDAARKLEAKQVATLRRLGLELVPVALATTESRIMARARLGTHEQLGAHTPRPRAPSDSWFSVQVHQSALNNGLARLDLEGRSFDMPELFAWIGQKLGRPDLAELDELPDDVKVTFAEKDAVRLRCEAGRVEVTIAVAQLTAEGRRWHDFQVRTYYAPVAEGLAPRFVRDDTIYLDGESLRGKLEIKLRAIFSRVLSKKRDLRLLDESITEKPQLADLAITQFTADDGWIALAYSRRREGNKVAERRE